MPGAKLRAGREVAAHAARQILHRQIQTGEAVGAGLQRGCDREDPAGNDLTVGQPRAAMLPSSRDSTVAAGGVHDADTAGG